MSNAPIRVRVFYPADPVGVVPGGIDTFLRGLIKHAPDDLEFSLVGMSTDPVARPLGRWTRCPIGDRHFDCFPVVAQADAGGRGTLPLSLRYTLGLRRHRDRLHGGFDVFDFHRVEPSLLFTADARPKNFYFHNDPQMLRLAASDNLWKHAPGFYEGLERRALAGLSSGWCVRETGVRALRTRYPELADKVRFLPTWVDPDVFSPPGPGRRRILRHGQALAQDLSLDQPWLISVGRLDTQKDPLRMLDALIELRQHGLYPHWLVVGDGVLRVEMQRKVVAAGLASQVRFLGLLPPAEIAEWLRGSDVYVLSSAYEGMPMALLEALGCGLPAVVTDVGEVRRVVQHGLNGAIVQGDDAHALACALVQVVADGPQMAGAPAVAAVADYRPTDVLAPAYAKYRELGAGVRSVRLSATRAQQAARSMLNPPVPAVGIPIHALEPRVFSDSVLDWARERQSRYVCFVNVHSSVHAARDELHRQALLAADLAAPDGAPIAWTVGAKRGRRQPRIDGPGTMWRLCQLAARAGIKVGLYGGSPQTLRALQQALRAAMPGLDVAYAHSPPYREPSPAEDRADCEAIARSGVGLLFVGLGCPKQERWMAAHRGRVPAVMLGVGAAFDFHAGTAPRAPTWMRENGLEWLHRLGSEPRRLGPRYLHTNLMFVAKSAREAVRQLRPTAPSPAATPGTARVLAAGPLRSRRPAPDRHDDHRDWDRDTDRDEGRDERRERRVAEPDGLGTAPFETLAQRIEASLAPDQGRLIGFMGSAGGEGTSTVARAYVSAVVADSGRRVLLLETQGTGMGTATDRGPDGVIQALAAGRPLHHLARPLRGGGMVARLGAADTPQAVQALVSDSAFWAELRCHFDDIVIDLPAAKGSPLGLALASHCDGVVLVVEAAKTRAPLARRRVAELRAVQANVLGTVLNKRSVPALAAGDSLI